MQLTRCVTKFRKNDLKYEFTMLFYQLSMISRLQLFFV